MTAIETHDLIKAFPGNVRALDGLDVTFERDRIHGLLGRNGSGKTTLMQLLTGQVFATSGTMRVLGQHPVENPDVLSKIAFVQESQTYPDAFTSRYVLRVARTLHEGWSDELEARLIEDFELPLDRKIKKLSRGQLSAIGVIVGLASRAPITFFDEPYLGLDAVARKIFYDRLLEDFTAHPRTILLSSHHIDEVANLLETVTVIDKGRLVLRAEVDDLTGAVLAISGTHSAVDELALAAEVLERTDIGGLSTVTVRGPLTATAQDAAARLGLETRTCTLQEAFVAITEANRAERRSAA